MRKIIFFALLLATAGSAMAKGDKAIYKDKTIETPNVDIYIVNAAATEGYTKFKIKINNKSNESLVLKTQDLIFVIGGKEYKPTSEKTLVIGPSSEDYKVVDLKGSGFVVDKYSIKINCLYRVKAEGKPIRVPDFKLPASANDFTIGGFKCSMSKQVRKTDVTEVSFDCNYTGAKLGLVNPSKVSLKMPNGRIYANMHQGRPLMLAKGETDHIALVWKRIPVSDGDMQFVDMYIQFGEAFAEAKLEKMADMVVEMEKDGK
jgi:hypothetical protein